MKRFLLLSLLINIIATTSSNAMSDHQYLNCEAQSKKQQSFAIALDKAQKLEQKNEINKYNKALKSVENYTNRFCIGFDTLS